MHFAHDSLVFTLGAKLERNHFGGWGPEPSANLLWMPAKRHSIWISAARPLRTPSLFEIGIGIPVAVLPASKATGGLPVLGTLKGTAGYLDEAVKDFEVGYRGQMSKTFSMDLTVFYDQLSNVRSVVQNKPVLVLSPVPQLDVTASMRNGAAATGKGAESSLAWQVLPKWKLEGSYTYDLTDVWLGSSAATGSAYAGGKAPPHNKWRLQSYVNLSKSWQFDTFLYWTSQADLSNVYGQLLLVPSYARLDIRLGYKASRHWQLSLAGQNLLQAHHLEGMPEVLTAYSYVKRGVYLKSTWQF